MLQIIKPMVFKLFQAIQSRRLRSVLVTSLCVFVGPSVVAQTDTEIKAASAKVMTSLQEVLKMNTFVDANVRFCFDYAEETVPSVQLASSQWRTENNIDNLMTIVDDINHRLKQTIEKLETEFYLQNLELLENRALSQATNWCQQFPELLQSDNMNLKRNFVTELQTIGNFAEIYLNKQRNGSRSIDLPNQILEIVSNPSYQDLKAAGINPRYKLIPTEFRCYAERSGSFYVVPDFVLQAKADGSYQSSFGTGTYATLLEDDETRSDDLTWTGVLGEFSSSYIRFNDHGQRIVFNSLRLDDQSYDYDCYQQGPRETEALIRFRLMDPQIGRYLCSDTDGATQTPIDFLEGRRYSLGDEYGRYTVDIRDNTSSSDIEFVTGPLEGSESYYFEEVDTGFRKLSFSEIKSYFPTFNSTSSLEMTCTATGSEGVSYAKYSNETAPLPPAGSGGLSGFYADSVSSRTAYGYGKSSYDFYYFTPDGYVYRSEPEGLLSDIQCQLTKPNGAPSCDTYKVLDGQLEIQAENGDPELVDITELDNVPTASTDLEGKFWANAGETIGICGPFSYCSSWYKEIIFTFTRDGQFLEGGRSQNLSSFDTAIGSTDTSSFGRSSNAGTYSIEGNRIELRYNNGKVAQHFIAIFDTEDFHMDGWSYGPKTDE